MSESIVVDEAPLVDEPITETQELETQEAQTEETPQSEPEIPAKYAGKTLSEVIEMHQNVEQALGKQGAELGEQRKLMQSLIEAQNKANETTPPEEPVIQEDNFYDDPVSAVNKAIENHPDVIKAREERMNNMQKHNLEALDKAYPDWQKTVANSDFQKFSDSVKKFGYYNIKKSIFQEVPSILTFEEFEKYFNLKNHKILKLWTEFPQLYILLHGVKK